MDNNYPIIIINLHNADRYNELDDYQVIEVDRTSPVGNPFTMRSEEERNLVCDKYEKYFQLKVADKTDIAFMQYLRNIWRAHKQGPVALACWCAPKRCHAETIRNFILSFD